MDNTQSKQDIAAGIAAGIAEAEAVNDGDSEKASDIMDSIHLSVSRVNGLTPELRDKLKDQVMNGFSETTTFERVEQLRRMGRNMEADQLLEITR